MEKVKSLFCKILFFCTILLGCKKIKINTTNYQEASLITVHLTGKVLNISTNEGIKNTTVQAHWHEYKSSCLLCFIKPLETFTTTKTDNLGNFNIDIKIDTTIFNNPPEHYILDVNNIDDDYIASNNFSFYQYKSPIINLQFNRYSKTQLKLLLQRDSSDVFKSYDVYHYFFDNINNLFIQPNYQISDFDINYSQVTPYTSLSLTTAANFWTRIYQRKISTSNNIQSYVYDSIYCTTNNLNIITIKY